MAQKNDWNVFSPVFGVVAHHRCLDDAGLPYVYGASKVLDMLGYGSFLASSNTAKAAITKAYLGLSSVADSSNPLVYSQSQTVNLLPLLAYQKIYYDFFSESQWENIWLTHIMQIIGTVNHN